MPTTISRSDYAAMFGPTTGDKVRLGPKAVLRFSFQDVMEEELNRELYEAALRDSMTRIYNKLWKRGRSDSTATDTPAASTSA